MRVRSWPVYGVALAVLWLFVRGVTLDPWSVVGEFLIGLAFGLSVAFVFRRLYTPTTDPVRSVRAAPYAGLYLANFLYELVTASTDVAVRALAPSMPLEPAVVVVPLRVRTDVAITTIANSITLTPGTLTMDYDPVHNALFVHAIDGRDREAVVDPIRTWEEYALAIFDEELKPGDPVPEVPASLRTDGGADHAADPGGRDGDDGGEADGE